MDHTGHFMYASVLSHHLGCHFLAVSFSLQVLELVQTLAAVADPIKMLASTKSDHDIADILKSCKRLLTVEGFVANAEACGLKDALISLAKGTAKESVTKTAADLCDKAKCTQFWHPLVLQKTDN
jgi:hypothetical protein